MIRWYDRKVVNNVVTTMPDMAVQQSEDAEWLLPPRIIKKRADGRTSSQATMAE